MRKFKKITIWTPEGDKDLDTLSIIIINDNLKNSMQLYYEIGYEESIEDTTYFKKIYEGNVSIFDMDEDQKYTNLGGEENIGVNEEIYSTVAKMLRVNLVK